MPEACFTRPFEAPARSSLRDTLGGLAMGPFDPSLKLDAARARMALRVPAGPLSLEVVEEGGRLGVRAWGPGVDGATGWLPALLGLEDDASGFAPPAGPVAELWREHPGLRLPRLPAVFPRLLELVALQLVTRTEALAAWGRLVRRLGEPAPGPCDLTLPPAPSALAATPEHELVALGLLPRQARTMRRLAREASRVERAAARGPEALAALLEGVPGVGPWTVSYLLGSALGVADAVVLRDYNLPHLVAWVLAGEERGDDARLCELLEPYRGHRFRVIRLLWLGGRKAPRRGPRRAVPGRAGWGSPRG